MYSCTLNRLRATILDPLIVFLPWIFDGSVTGCVAGGHNSSPSYVTFVSVVRLACGFRSVEALRAHALAHTLYSLIGSIGGSLTKPELDESLTVFDLKRLDSYTRNLVDYHTITDLVPYVARCYFLRRIPVHLSPAQSAIVLAVGLQMRTLDEVSVCVGFV